MKCQKCGKNEVNFHYSSNVNGCVTETSLCSQCAAESGYNLESLFDMRSLFGNSLQLMSGRSFLPMPFFNFGMAPQAVPALQDYGCEDACGAPLQESPATEVDGDMQKRRELNVLKEQMRLAAEKDDFEKAMELRDQIRQMEGSNEI